MSNQLQVHLANFTLLDGRRTGETTALLPDILLLTIFRKINSQAVRNLLILPRSQNTTSLNVC